MTVRWAFIGAGRHAELWMIPAMAAASNATLLGVWGQHVDKARNLTERYGIPTTYASVDDVLSDRNVDAVYVSTPNYLHVEHSVAALRAGKHVLCEKPMATSVAEAREMTRAAEAAGKQLGLGFHLRHHQLVGEARAHLDAGRIGEVLYATGHFNPTSSPPPRLNIAHSAWKSNPDKMGGAGALMGLGVHVLDAVRYLVNSEVRSVSAISSGQTPERPLESFGQVLLEFESGAQAHVLYGGRFPLAQNDIWIYGERGRIGLKEVVDVRTRGILELTLPEDSPGSIAEVHQPRLIDHYQAELEDFSRCVEEGRAFLASGMDGLRSVEVSEAIIESQRSGRRVTVGY